MSILLRICLSALVGLLMTAGLSPAEEGLKPSFFYYHRSQEADQLIKSRTNWADADADFYLQIARDHLSQSRLEEAIWGFRRAVSLSTNSSTQHFWLGRAYEKKAETAPFYSRWSWAKKAFEEFRIAASLNPANIEARRALIEYYLKTPAVFGGDRKKAAEEIEKLRGYLAGPDRKER